MKKYAPKFLCKKCDYTCSSKFLWEQHCSTQKHKRQHSATLGNAKYVPYICEGCGREYKQRSGLWRHRKKCNSEISQEEEGEVLTLASDTNDLKQLMQQMLSGLNKEGEIKDQMITQLQAQNKIIQDMIPKLGNNNNNWKDNLLGTNLEMTGNLYDDLQLSAEHCVDCCPRNLIVQT